MILRDYQSKAHQAIRAEWEDVTSTLIVQPTGTGKTILFADVIKSVYPQRSIVVAHREELIFQARDKIAAVSGLRCEVEMGEYRAEASDLFHRASVVVATVQTLTAGGDGGGRMGKFKPEDFGLLVIDEAHHATSPSYRRVIDYFRTNPKLKVLGVTATPDRADEQALGQVFESVAFDYEILDAIHDGWLVPIEQQMVQIQGLDFSAVRTTAGDLNGGDLARVLEAEKNLHGFASASLDIIGQRRTLVFTASVVQAQQMCEIFNRHKPGMAAWVCGETDKDERRKVLQDFSSGVTQVVCNCAVLTEGFDEPGVEVIVMARPTKSRSLYAQMCGRSTRPLPGVVDGPATPEERRAAIAASNKPTCLILDFVGNSGKHKLITSADILGGNVSDEAVERAIRRAAKDGKPMRMDEALEEEEEQIKEERRLEEVRRRARLVAKAQFTSKQIDPFNAFQLEPVRSRGWDEGRVLSEKQRAKLLQSGIDPDAMPYHQARQLLNELFRRWREKLCTLRQANWLSNHGYDSNITFERAREIMNAWAANGWRRPAPASPPRFAMPPPRPVLAMAEPDPF